MKSHFFALGLAALTATFAAGCAADADPIEEGEGESLEDALTSRQLKASSVEIADMLERTTVTNKVTLGAPKKVKSIITGIRKLKPTDPVPRCLMRNTHRYTFMDEAGKKVATVSTYCAGFGNISFENGNDGYGVRIDGTVVQAAKDAPLAVGDGIWGITKVEITKFGSADKVTVQGDGIKPLLKAYDLDEVPDPNASFPRCPPSHSVTLKRGNDAVATTSFICGAIDAASAPAEIKASYTMPNPAGPPAAPLARGGIKLDPRPFLRALSNAQ